MLWYKKNYNLYTQCLKSKQNGEFYCKSCLKQCKKTNDTKNHCMVTLETEKNNGVKN